VDDELLAPPAPATDAEAAIPEPSRQLPSQARTYFIFEALAGGIGTTIVALVVAGVLDDHVPDMLVLALRVLVPLVAIGGALALGALRYRHWRYELREEEIDLQRGALVVTRTLIPIVRVQHVDTRRSWLADQIGVQAVVVHTAAGSHEIPALTPGEAAAVRDRIALLARQPDEL
jgi:uncharacterized protein